MLVLDVLLVESGLVDMQNNKVLIMPNNKNSLLKKNETLKDVHILQT